MKYAATLLATKNMEAAKKFYTELIGLSIDMDLGANVGMGQIALQENTMWADFVCRQPEDIQFGGAATELVFELEDLDEFIVKLKAWPGIELVHDVRTFPWGQRVVRFYDPDKHVIEVGETMQVVVKRFIAQGLTDQEIMQASMMPPDFIQMCRQ